MEEFNALYVNSYTIVQLADFICGKKASLEEIYQAGLLRPKRVELEEELERRRLVVEQDETVWQEARVKDTVQAYQFYLRLYDKQEPEYRGKHVMDAWMRIEELKREYEGLKAELLRDMKDNPFKYNQEKLNALFKGVDEVTRQQSCLFNDVFNRFVASGQTLSNEDLWREDILPRDRDIEYLLKPDVQLRATQISELGGFPQEDRTDVYFLGVPRSGKSSMLAGLLSYMYKKGCATYQPHYNSQGEDLVCDYYYGLIESTNQGMFPASTNTDTVSFMKIDLHSRRGTNSLNFVEMAGEAFRQATVQGKIGKKAWEGFGAGQCLQVPNRKLLFFIVDYGVENGQNENVTSEIQRRALDSSLKTFLSDGVGKDNAVGCTMSKVDTVAIIVTKSDMLGVSDEDRKKKAIKYVNDNFATFKRNLKEICKKYNINRPENYDPYIMPFSLGKVSIGNRYQFNPRDSEAVVDFISCVTVRQREGFWATMFG